MTDTRSSSPDLLARKIGITAMRQVLFAASLIVALGSLSPEVSAQATRSILVDLDTRDKEPVCVGDSLRFIASVSPYYGEFVYLAASALSPVGRFPYEGLVVVYPSDVGGVGAPSGGGSAVFQALVAGKSKLLFEKFLPMWNPDPNSYGSLTRDVEVVDCTKDKAKGSPGEKTRRISGPPRVNRPPQTFVSRYTVSSTSTWSVGMEILATINGATIESGDGKTFMGVADVSWKTSVIGQPGCQAAEYRISPSKAAIRGVLDEDNRLEVSILFGPKDFSGFATCGPGSVSTSNKGTPAPLDITVPATGGTAEAPQAATAKNGTFMGSAKVVVSRGQSP